jgi:putative transposase
LALYPCFSERDIFIVARSPARCERALHAYVLMDNHAHLLVTPPRTGAISRVKYAKVGRQDLGPLNARNRRTVSLWEGRYKACLVSSEDYVPKLGAARNPADTALPATRQQIVSHQQMFAFLS